MAFNKNSQVVLKALGEGALGLANLNHAQYVSNAVEISNY